MATAIIDGDILSYLCLAHQDPPYNGFKIHQPGVVPEIIKLELLEDYIEKSYNRFIDLIDEMVEENFCKDYLLAFSGDNSKLFRTKMYPEYKATRLKPEGALMTLAPTIRKRLVSNNIGHINDTYEADDLIGIWATNFIKKDKDYIIMSIDKDLKQIPGIHYNINKKEIEEVTPEKARNILFTQLLTGDSTDNIKGVPGIGPVKAKKILGGIKSVKLYRELTENTYKDYYGKDWEEMYILNMNLVYILRNTKRKFHWDDVL